MPSLQIHRRTLGIGLCALAITGVRPGASLRADEVGNKWLTEWMKGARDSGANPLLGRFTDGFYFVRKTVSWKPNAGQSEKPVTVPVGFVTDFAGVPGKYWQDVKPEKNFSYPPILLSWMYWSQDRTREHADQTFRLAMEDVGVGAARAAEIQQAATATGQDAWNALSAARSRNEKRVLTRLPDDAKETWASWKDKPGVFGE